MIKRITAGFFATLIILVLGFIIFLSTPFGLTSAVYLSQKLSGGKLHIINAKGSLFHLLTIEQLRYIDKTQRFEANQVKLDWRPIFLFTKRLNVKKLTASSIKYVILKKSASTSNSSNPISLSLPLQISIQEARVNHITYYSKPAQQTIKIRNTHLTAILTNKKVNVILNSFAYEPYQIQLHFSVVGKPNDYAVNSKIFSPLITSAITGQGNLKHLNLNIKESSALGGTLRGAANVQWQPQLLITTNLRVNKLQLGDHWISGLVKAHYSNLEDFSVNTRLNTSLGTLNIIGHHKDDWNLKWDAQLTHLERLSPLLLGSINGQGTITGDTHRPDTQGHLELKEIAFETNKLKHLKAQWQVHLNNDKPSTIHLQASKIETPNVQVENTNFNATGTLLKHNSKLTMSTSLGKFTAVLNGQYNPKQQSWLGNLPVLSLDGKALDHWHLKKPVQLQYSPQSQSIKPFCWLSTRGGRICLQGQKTPKNWNAQLTANINLAALQGIYPEDYTIKGQLQTDTKVSGDPIGITSLLSNISINHLIATLGDGALRQTLRFKPVTAKATYQKHKLNLQQQARTTDGDQLQIQFKAEPLAHLNFDSDPKVHGNVLLKLNRLNKFNIVLPTTLNTKGALSFNFSIDGKWLKPKIKAIVDFTKATIGLPDLGIALSRGLLVAHTIKHKLNYSLKIFSNNVPLHGSGTLDLKDYSFDGESQLTGRNIPIINTLDYQAEASPALKIRIKHKLITLSGNVKINKAKISPQGFYSTVTLPTNDIVFVNLAPPLANRWQTTMDIKVSMDPDNVKLDTYGVTGNITGDLNIIEKPGQALIGDGKISLMNGKFDARGHKLAITQAVVNFRKSPIDNPNINITASRAISTNSSASIMQLGIDDLTVGVNVTGTAKHPKITLFSTPVTLNQTDILSYLILGHATGGGSAADLSILLNAFNSGGPSHIGDFMGKLEGALGFSEFGIQSETALDIAGNPIDSQNSFVVGKYITKKIYLRYSRGLIDQNNTFLLRYMITPKWAIQTSESNLGTGVDVIYTFYRH